MILNLSILVVGMMYKVAKKRMIIVGGQAMFRSLVIDRLEACGDFSFVGETSNGIMGLQLCDTLAPDFILLELELPDIDGLIFGNKVLVKYPNCKVMAFTRLTDAYSTHKAYEMGMHGYVDKNQPFSILEKAIITISQGGSYFSKIVQENRFKLQKNPNAFYKILSQREQEILIWVAEGLSCKEVGEKLFICPRTVVSSITFSPVFC